MNELNLQQFEGTLLEALAKHLAVDSPISLPSDIEKEGIMVFAYLKDNKGMNLNQFGKAWEQFKLNDEAKFNELTSEIKNIHARKPGN